MSRGGDNKILREKLHEMWHNNPRCCYCGKVTKIKPRHMQPKEDTATVEHIYDKIDIRRFITKRYRALALACYKCNQDKCRERNNQIGEYKKGCQIFDIIELVREKLPDR